MASLEKLVEKFLFEPQRVKPRDVLRLAAAFDYRLHKKGGSEYTFHKPGSPPLNIPTISGRHLKLRYVKRVVNILELEEWYESRRQA